MRRELRTESPGRRPAALPSPAGGPQAPVSSPPSSEPAAPVPTSQPGGPLTQRHAGEGKERGASGQAWTRVGGPCALPLGARHVGPTGATGARAAGQTQDRQTLRATASTVGRAAPPGTSRRSLIWALFPTFSRSRHSRLPANKNFKFSQRGGGGGGGSLAGSAPPSPLGSQPSHHPGWSCST